jgi:cadmium resistance protein CadD (predicted permease)
MPTEPIGFLGLVPICIGILKLIELILHRNVEEVELLTNYKEKIASITGDNISIYVPLFSQANGKEVAIYISIFLVLLGIWCLIGYLFVKQKYVHMVLPFLYFGLGIYIIVNSECYPWSIDKINNSTSSNIGSIIMPIITSILLIFWFRHSQSMRKNI